jgi:type IV fimbrial biogenesis protein FimT
MKIAATRGFTLIELMITLAVMGILFAVGFPSMSVWLQNSQIRTAAEGGLNGMQLARAEAVRRNAGVQLAFDANGGWTANVVAGGEVIQSRPASEGSANVTVAFSPADANTITFNGLGRVVLNADGSDSLTQIDFDSAAMTAAASRELRVAVSTGGVARMCDPQLAAGDPRAC